MTKPKAYDPINGQMYQMLYRYLPNGREWEHLDYAENRKELDYLAREYSLAYRGTPSEFMFIKLPRKYWP